MKSKGLGRKQWKAPIQRSSDDNDDDNYNDESDGDGEDGEDGEDDEDDGDDDDNDALQLRKTQGMRAEVLESSDSKVIGPRGGDQSQ